MADSRLADELATARMLLNMIERRELFFDHPIEVGMGRRTAREVAILKLEIRSMEAALARVPHA
jgi:hypothetical protein